MPILAAKTRSRLSRRSETLPSRNRCLRSHPKALYSVGQYIWSILTLGIALLVYWLRSTSVPLTKLTTQRLRIETGFLSKRIEGLELFRVDNVEVDMPLSMRMLGYGVLPA